MANSIQVVVKCQSGRVMVFGDTNVTASTTTTLKSQGVGLNQTDNIDLGNALVGETITHAFGTVTAATTTSFTVAYLFGVIENPDGSLAVPIEGGGSSSSCMPKLVRPLRVQVGMLLKVQLAVSSATAVKASFVTYTSSGKCNVFQVSAVADTETEITDLFTGGSIGQSLANQVITYSYATYPNSNGLNDDQAGNNFFFIEDSAGQLKDAIFPKCAKGNQKVSPLMGALRIMQNDTLKVTWGS
jgi:hypothetical protein